MAEIELEIIRVRISLKRILMQKNDIAIIEQKYTTGLLKKFSKIFKKSPISGAKISCFFGFFFFTKMTNVVVLHVPTSVFTLSRSEKMIKLTQNRKKFSERKNL